MSPASSFLVFAAILPFSTHILGNFVATPLAFVLYFSNQFAIAVALTVKLELARRHGHLRLGPETTLIRMRLYIMCSAMASGRDRRPLPAHAIHMDRLQSSSASYPEKLAPPTPPALRTKPAHHQPDDAVGSHCFEGARRTNATPPATKRPSSLLICREWKKVAAATRNTGRTGPGRTGRESFGAAYSGHLERAREAFELRRPTSPTGRPASSTLFQSGAAVRERFFGSATGQQRQERARPFQGKEVEVQRAFAEVWPEMPPKPTPSLTTTLTLSR